MSSDPERRPDSSEKTDPDADKHLSDDLSPEAREELEERADTGTSVRAEEPDEERTGEYGHTYMGRQMDESLKGKDRRPADEDDTEE